MDFMHSSSYYWSMEYLYFFPTGNVNPQAYKTEKKAKNGKKMFKKKPVKSHHIHFS